MPSTGILNGTLVTIKVDDTKINFLTKADLDKSHALRDASSKDSGGHKESLEGQRSWKMSGSAYLAFDATYGFDDLYTIMESREKVEVEFSTGVVGDKSYTGFAFITSLKASTGVEESVTFDFELEGTGPLVQAIIA